MSTDTIWGRIRQQPFTPFRLTVSDGRNFDTLHPEMIALTKQAVNIFLYGQGERPGSDYAARQVIVSPLHVTSVEDVPEFANA